MASERESVAKQNEEGGSHIGVVKKGEKEENREGGEREGREEDSWREGGRGKER